MTRRDVDRGEQSCEASLFGRVHDRIEEERTDSVAVACMVHVERVDVAIGFELDEADEDPFLRGNKGLLLANRAVQISAS